MQPSNRHFYAAGLLLAGIILLAVSPIFMRESPVGPVATSGWRLLLALPMALPLTWLARARAARHTAAPAGKPGARGIIMAMLSGACLALNLVVLNIAVCEISVATATFLDNLAPVAIAFLVWWLFAERPSRTLLGGLTIALAGAALLCGVAGDSGPSGGDVMLGLLAGLAAPVLYAGYFIFLRLASRAAVCAHQAVWLSTVGAALTLVPMMLVSQEPLPSGWQDWLFLAAYALIVQVLGQNWVARAMADLPTAPASLALLLQPVLSALLAWMWLSEAVGPLEWFGGALVLFGLAAGTGAIKWTQFLPRSAHAAALRTRTPD
ncbi:DMT family transporter [Laribacter hongkongensis]|uniref:EamA domain-containing protein n=1 Tax=Laribacter hongkongensis TaxID=168471 RepID=A0A248LP96_9NEIS|nr:DMT family transporter [Laribacter hongkongensis]ASJ25983.1 hypothetical protein LHGZ1_3152 [Laribacter hongkongensis]MCG9040043.1 DMT family transporter [Laribacter hongkongensis]MCG9068282.1 DMT family transporter [Laribacter hongkongensis]MCG9109667.1 DMT family transporter [Laribacter hongkongensis]MCG9121449.1 DMT family transporter [Laribacter hongkongensis]